MTRAAALLLASSALLLASSARARASVEAGQGGALGFGLPSLDVLADRVETAFYITTEEEANVPQDTAAANVRAWLEVIQRAEGTAQESDPYRVCYGYSHTIADLREHPAITGEWRGKTLPDGMCANAGFGPGCVSTAAGAYQLIKPTWGRARDALGLRDFSAAAQDAAAVWLTGQRGALEDVKAGRLAAAVNKCRNEWASLPGNYAKQGQRTLAELGSWFVSAGGNIA